MISDQQAVADPDRVMATIVIGTTVLANDNDNGTDADSDTNVTFRGRPWRLQRQTTKLPTQIVMATYPFGSFGRCETRSGGQAPAAQGVYPLGVLAQGLYTSKRNAKCGVGPEGGVQPDWHSGQALPVLREIGPFVAY